MCAKSVGRIDPYSFERVKASIVFFYERPIKIFIGKKKTRWNSFPYVHKWEEINGQTIPESFVYDTAGRYSAQKHYSH